MHSKYIMGKDKKVVCLAAFELLHRLFIAHHGGFVGVMVSIFSNNDLNSSISYKH